MRKYNLSKIMKRAWELVKKSGMTISSGLKKAWEEAKSMAEKIKFTGRALVARVENGKINQYVGTEYDSESNYFSFSLWERGDMTRVYINDYKRRGLGYIDLATGRINAEKKDTIETANYFLEAYEF